MKNKKSIRISIAAMLILSTTFAIAQTQNYPNKPIRIIVPNTPGGQTDLLGRMIGQKLSEKWGQSVIVDNRGGANTIIGMTLAAKAAPDGYTLAVTSTSLAINPGLVRDLPYDGIKDLAPITNLANIPFLLVAHPSVPAKSIKELIALAKARPAQLTFGSGGNGSPSHLSGELLNSMAGIKIVHVPYKGLGQSLVGLLSGQVDMVFAGPLIVLPHVNAGKLRAIAVGSPARFPAMPAVPTVAESGLPGYESGIWFGMVAPAGTPIPIITLLNKEIVSILAQADVKQRMEAINATIIGDTPEQFSNFIKSETAKWSKIAKNIPKE
ncbi:MAG: tripartite tricarboxylate transporter substrate binding protein [Burkholderiales bacterium]|nr:tripartite tricarboxylate transporter substrate binding protein [Burkholderiales bacterium]